MTTTIHDRPDTGTHPPGQLLYRCTLDSASRAGGCDQQAHRWDAVDAYFTCLMACDLLDHHCPTQCGDDLRQADGQSSASSRR